MELNEYQFRSTEYRLSSADETYALLGLIGEVGEFYSNLAKGLRDGVKDNDAFTANCKKELGDILWFVAAIASDLELKLEDVAQGNIDKLASRQVRGKIQGSGDDR